MWLQRAFNFIWDFSIGLTFLSPSTLLVHLSWSPGLMKRVDFQLPFTRFNRQLKKHILLLILYYYVSLIYQQIVKVWLATFVMMVTMILIFTCIPWIHCKITNTLENASQPEQNAFTFNELSRRTLVIVANITGHSVLNIHGKNRILYCLLISQ